MDSALDLRVMGGADLRHRDGSPAQSVLAQPKRLALLCYLAAADSGTFHRREQLLALLWPDAAPENARAALRNALYFLRRSLGSGLVEARGAEEVRLTPGYVRCDTTAFMEALDAGRLEEALENYGGPLLPGFGVEDAPPWNEWLDRERERLARCAGEAAERLAVLAERAGDLSRAIHWSHRAVELRWDEEEPVRRLMVRLAAAGDHAAARAAYEGLARRSQAAFGEPPSQATRRVFDSLRKADPPDVPPIRPVRHPQQPLAPAPAGAPVPPSVRRRRWALAFPAALVAVAAGAAVAAALRTGPEVPTLATAPAAWDRVAVLPFQVHGTRHEYLGGGMVDLLSAALDGAGGLHTADARAVLAAVPYSGREVTPAAARAAAERLGVRFVVLGSVTASAERLRMSASLYDRLSGAEPVAVARAEGSTDDVFRLVDALAIGLTTNRLRGPAARLDRVATRTSESLPALKLYLQGTSELRAGRFQRAIDLLQQALGVDTAFALASYRLAVAADGAGARPSLVQAALARALRHSHRLPERERLFVDAYARADEKGFRTLLERYPDDPDGWYHLGDLAFHANPGRGQPFSDARDAFQRSLASDSLHVAALLHLTRIEAWAGNRGAVQAFTARALARAPEGEEALELWAIRALALDDPAAWATARARLARAGDNRAWITLWRAVIHTGEVERGDALFGALVAEGRPPGVRAAGHAGRAQLALARGRPAEARAHLAAAERLDPAVARRFRAAMAAYPLVGCGRGAGQLSLADSLPALPLPTMDAARRSAGAGGAHAGGALRAMAAICRGDLRAARAAATQIAAGGDPATAALVQAQTVLASGGSAGPERLASLHGAGLPEAHARWLAAEFARLAGRDDEAFRLLASIPADLEYANVPYYAPAELRMAELAERGGRPRDAIRHYTRFVHTWRNAEPPLFPLVEQARRRLAALGGPDPRVDASDQPAQR